MMKKQFFILTIILTLIIIGFIIGLSISKFGVGQTLIACPCQGINGQRTCNTVTWGDPIFISGILNIVQQCNTKEIIICENGIEVDKNIDFKDKDCKTKWYFFWSNIN